MLSPGFSAIRVQTREPPTAGVVWQVQICIALTLPFFVFVKGLQISVKSDVWTERFVCRPWYMHDSNVTKVYFAFRWRPTRDRLRILSCSFLIMFRGYAMRIEIKTVLIITFSNIKSTFVQSSYTCKTFEGLLTRSYKFAWIWHKNEW